MPRTMPGTTPPPVLGSFHESRTHRIALHISTDREAILIRLNWKRLEAPLIDVALADAVTMLMPALGMREGQPIHEPREVAIVAWPDHEMPVVWHDAVGQESHRHACTGLHQYALKRSVVPVVLKQRPAGVRPIEHVIDHVS